MEEKQWSFCEDGFYMKGYEGKHSYKSLETLYSEDAVNETCCAIQRILGQLPRFMRNDILFDLEQIKDLD